MRMKIKAKYLVFPINIMSTKKKVYFQQNGKQVYKLDMYLDNVNPTFFAYIDVSRFVGEILDISISPEMDLMIKEADAIDIDGVYQEALRPQVHFTTKNGWINDPNGLVYWNGMYHMFYQYNPAAPVWDNMHWGHAVSRDLIHWEEKSIALFPDERGTMYSGSAVVDRNNLLGTGQETGVLFYTTTEPFCQNLSFSTDDFATIQRY